MDRPDALGPMLGCCSHLARERMDARLAGCDVTPAQARVLMYVHRSGGQAPQHEVTRFLRVKPSTANGILDRMEEKGLLRRSVSNSDARRSLLGLTDKGARQQERFHRAFWETEEAAQRGLSAQERADLLALLGRVIQNLEEDRTLC